MRRVGGGVGGGGPVGSGGSKPTTPAKTPSKPGQTHRRAPSSDGMMPPVAGFTAVPNGGSVRVQARPPQWQSPTPARSPLASDSAAQPATSQQSVATEQALHDLSLATLSLASLQVDHSALLLRAADLEGSVELHAETARVLQEEHSDALQRAQRAELALQHAEQKATAESARADQAEASARTTSQAQTRALAEMQSRVESAERDLSSRSSTLDSSRSSLQKDLAQALSRVTRLQSRVQVLEEAAAVSSRQGQALKELQHLHESTEVAHRATKAKLARANTRETKNAGEREEFARRTETHAKERRALETQLAAANKAADTARTLVADDRAAERAEKKTQATLDACRAELNELKVALGTAVSARTTAETALEVTRARLDAKEAEVRDLQAAEMKRMQEHAAEMVRVQAQVTAAATASVATAVAAPVAAAPTPSTTVAASLVEATLPASLTITTSNASPTSLTSDATAASPASPLLPVAAGSSDDGASSTAARDLASLRVSYAALVLECESLHADADASARRYAEAAVERETLRGVADRLREQVDASRAVVDAQTTSIEDARATTVNAVRHMRLRTGEVEALRAEHARELRAMEIAHSIVVKSLQHESLALRQRLLRATSAARQHATNANATNNTPNGANRTGEEEWQTEEGSHSSAFASPSSAFSSPAPRGHDTNDPAAAAAANGRVFFPTATRPSPPHAHVSDPSVCTCAHSHGVCEIERARVETLAMLESQSGALEDLVRERDELAHAHHVEAATLREEMLRLEEELRHGEERAISDARALDTAREALIATKEECATLEDQVRATYARCDQLEQQQQQQQVAQPSPRVTDDAESSRRLAHQLQELESTHAQQLSQLLHAHGAQLARVEQRLAHSEAATRERDLELDHLRQRLHVAETEVRRLEATPPQQEIDDTAAAMHATPRPTRKTREVESMTPVPAGSALLANGSSTLPTPAKPSAQPSPTASTSAVAATYLASMLHTLNQEATRPSATTAPLTPNQSPSASDPAPGPPSAAAALLDFLLIVGRCKHEKRTGWVNERVHLPESVADHQYRMAVMSLTCVDYRALGGGESQEASPIDVSSASRSSRIDPVRASQMSLVHDLAEALVGDITPTQFSGVTKAEKHRLEANAMERICKTLQHAHGTDDDEDARAGVSIADRIRDLWLEYETGATPTAQYVKNLDKLDMYLQAYEYQLEAAAHTQSDTTDTDTAVMPLIARLERFYTSVDETREKIWKQDARTQARPQRLLTAAIDELQARRDKMRATA